MKSLTVIGAGISGLTCAIYAQRSGFRTVILEKAGGPGGRILYRTPALGVRKTADGVCVLTESGTIKSDAVVISSDARTAIDKLFEEPVQARWAKRLRRKMRTAQILCKDFGKEFIRK
ncbi:MAG: NAD(P)-binding protein [Bacteroidales bacterium]|nr:NAD(P)-binding protein [Bacteroidales bacterium]MBR0082598.1 NAD(P)-binding protein [Bacteroidales bacterium]MBR0292319.1 NAD(P)-binding protein [Bacteroidales bacterium]